MEDYVYVILGVLALEAVTVIVAGIWIWALGVRASDLRVEICELRNEIRGLQRMQDHHEDKDELEELSDDAALADFDSHDVDPLVPDDGSG